MPFLQTIQTALANYDQQKGFFRKLFGDQSAINALRQLSDADQGDLLKNYQCFLDHPSSPSQASYQVHQAVLEEVYKVHPERKKSLDEALAQYDQKKGIHRRIFGDHPAIKALRKLSAADQVNLSKLLQCFEENMPEKAQTSYHVYECLTQENSKNAGQHAHFNVVAQYYLPIPELKSPPEAECLTQENFNTGVHGDPVVLANALKKLQHLRAHLTNENFNAVREHPNPLALAKALNILFKAKCLTQENKNAVCQCKNPQSLARALAAGATLLMAKWALRCKAKNDELIQILTHDSVINRISENQNFLRNHPHSRSLNRALKCLYQAKCLTQENFNILSQHANPEAFSFALAYLNGAGCLTQENFNILSQHQKPEELACALLCLYRVQCLTQENSIVLSQHAEPPRKLAEALKSLRDADHLNQANLNLLLNPANSFLLTDRAIEIIWSRIPNHLLTQEVFSQLTALASEEDPQRQIRNYVDLILSAELNLHIDAMRIINRAINNINNPFNNTQSTHTASVHKSVSESARKLWARYGKIINTIGLGNIIQTVKDFVNSLVSTDKNTDKNRAAKYCIERITNSNYEFTDPKSEVTTRQLVALSHLAIHDDESRIGSLEDAQTQFIEGLYEIQRGYNLSDDGIDQGGEDRPICTGGTFNKPIEKLQGIHPDCEVLLITKNHASAKLPIVVHEEAMRYLSTMAKPQSKEELNAFVELIDKIKKHGLKVIWEYIKNIIAERLFDEFGSLYPAGKDSADFSAFIDFGKLSNLNEKDLNELQESARELKNNQGNFRTSQPAFFATQPVEENKEPDFTPEQKARPRD